MTDKSPTLAEMQSYLSHKADPVAKVAPPSGDLPRKGSRPQFDEDKVKRDGRGRFSKKQAVDMLNKQMDVLRAKQDAELKRKFGVEVSNTLTLDEVRKIVKSSDKATAKEFTETFVDQVTEVGTLVNDVQKKTGYTFTLGADRQWKIYKPSAEHSDEIDGYFGDARDLSEEALEHYGIKGMRWGIRRPDGPAGTVGSAGGRGPKENSSDAKGSATSSAARKGTKAWGSDASRSNPRSDYGDTPGGGRSGGGYARGSRKGGKDSEGSSKADAAKAVLKSKAVTTAKTAYGINSQLKAIDKRLALPSLAFAAGVAVAGVTGVGLPAVAGLSIGHKVFSDPTVQAALKSASSYSKAIIKDVGNVKLSDMKMPNMPKVKNPFGTKSSSRTVIEVYSTPGQSSKPGEPLNISGLSTRS